MVYSELAGLVAADVQVAEFLDPVDDCMQKLEPVAHRARTAGVLFGLALRVEAAPLGVQADLVELDRLPPAVPGALPQAQFVVAYLSGIQQPVTFRRVFAIGIQQAVDESACIHPAKR